MSRFNMLVKALHRFRPLPVSVPPIVTPPATGATGARMGLNLINYELSTTSGYTDARFADLTMYEGFWVKPYYGGSDPIHDAYNRPAVGTGIQAGIGFRLPQLVDQLRVGDWVMPVPNAVTLPSINPGDFSSGGVQGMVPSVRFGADLGGGFKELIVTIPGATTFLDTGAIDWTTAMPGVLYFDQPSAQALATSSRRPSLRKVGEADPTAVLTPEYAATIAGLGCLRFMDARPCNFRDAALPPPAWADRPHYGTESYEFILASLKAAGPQCDPWFELRHMESKDWWTGLLTALATEAWWKGRVIVGYDNELWNSAFSNYNFLQRDGLLAGYGIGNGQGGAIGMRADMEFNGAAYATNPDGSVGEYYWDFFSNRAGVTARAHTGGKLFFARFSGEGEGLYRCLKDAPAGTPFADTSYFTEVGGGMAVSQIVWVRFACEMLRQYTAIADGILGAARVQPVVNDQTGIDSGTKYKDALSWSPTPGGPTLAQRGNIGVAIAPYVGGGFGSLNLGNYNEAPASVQNAAPGAARVAAMIAAFTDPAPLAYINNTLVQMAAQWPFGPKFVYEVGSHTVVDWPVSTDADKDQLSRDFNALMSAPEVEAVFRNHYKKLLDLGFDRICVFCENGIPFNVKSGSKYRFGTRMTATDRTSNALVRAFEAARALN